MANFAPVGTIFVSKEGSHTSMTFPVDTPAQFTAYDGTVISVKKGDFYLIRTVEEELDSLNYLLENGIIQQERYDSNVAYLERNSDKIRAIVSVKVSK